MSNPWPAGARAAAVLLTTAAIIVAGGCRARCRTEPTCVPALERRVLGPLDTTGYFPVPPGPIRAIPDGVAPVGPAAGGSAPLESGPDAPVGSAAPSAATADLVQPVAVASPASAPPRTGGPEVQTVADWRSVVGLGERLPSPPGADAGASDTDSAAAEEPLAGELLEEGPAPRQLSVPDGLPGADAPPLAGAEYTTGSEASRRAALERTYFPLPTVEGSPPTPAPAGGPLDLGQLQELAMANSPSLRVAAAQAEAARGAAIQAGAYPNPELGYESDTIGTARTAGYHGAYVNQTIVTAGKLRLARAAAEVDYQNAQLALRQARIDVATAVRTAYFQALVAQEKLRIQATLAGFTEEVLRTQVRLVGAGEAAAYEPLQLRVYVTQSRAGVVQAEQQLAAARRRLAAAIGLADLPLGELVGRPDMPIPAIDYDSALASMRANHTALAIARNSVTQAERQLQLARVTPIPNINTYVAVQHDYTFAPGATTVNVQAGGPLPLFNRNTGNIIAAQATLYQTQQSIAQVDNDLTAQLADAYGRYELNRRLAQDFQPSTLRDQVRSYRGVYERYRNDAEGVAFNDIIVVQQTLSALLIQYVNLLGDRWQAVVDVAQLLQVDDIYLVGELAPVTPLPELEGPQTRPSDPEAQPKAPLAQPNDSEAELRRGAE